ncbi:MAG: LmbE family protein [Ramlibacter sp.]|nr:LmbE family protein [Ramlibacter sp.]
MVSVLIRSVDRGLLQEALASVALQTYPDIEVVVIAAKPGHRELPARCGEFPLRLVTTDSPLPRSKAANRALDEARGQYLLFLDDDDWLMPGHIARLAEVLQAQPHALAVYTGVSLANDKGEPMGQAMDLPFDSVRQLAGNLTPIHAVMFSRQLLALGVRFDEQLDHYEDWDFWLQIGRHTALVHLPGVSAVYRIHESSGVHNDPGPTGASSQDIYRKWQGLWTSSDQGALMQYVWVAHDLEIWLRAARVEISRQAAALDEEHATVIGQQTTLAQQQAMLASQQATIAGQHALLAQQQATIHEQAGTTERLRAHAENDRNLIGLRESQIAELMNSNSWKVTAPMRYVSRLLGAVRSRTRK